MWRVVAERLAATAPVLVLVTFGVFLLIHLTPGDPIDWSIAAKSGIATVSAVPTRRSAADPPSASADASSNRRIWSYELHDVSSVSSTTLKKGLRASCLR